MRRIVYVLFLLLYFNHIKGELLEENKIWEYYSVDYGASEDDSVKYSLTQYKIQGEKELSGKKYKVLCQIGTTSWIGLKRFSLGNPSFNVRHKEENEEIAFLREEEEKVWRFVESDSILISNPDYTEITEIPTPESREVLLYDFGITEGQELQLYVGGYIGWNALADVEVSRIQDIPTENFGIQKQIELQNRDGVMEPLNNLKVDIRYVVEVGNVGFGNLVNLGGELWPMVDCLCYREEYFNNLYDEEGRVLFSGANVKAPDSSWIQQMSFPHMDLRKTYKLNGLPVDNTGEGGILIKDGKKILHHSH